jgi:hypothetical protein
MSGRKSNLKRFKTITSGDMSGSLTSAITAIEFMDNIGYQISFSGAPVGNFQVQVSMDYDQDINGNVIHAGEWIAIPLSNGSIDVPTSLGSPIYIDLNQLTAPWIKLVYTRTSGSGTCNTFISGKMV